MLRPRMLRRLCQLFVGLWLYGASLALFVASGLGNAPWDVLHQGLAHTVGLSVGTWVVLAGAIVLAAWIPLRQRPGLGTISNVLVVGLALDATLELLPAVHAVPARVALIATGVVANALATAAYIGAGLGPGPRDGLMTGIASRTDTPIAVVRMSIEVTVLAAGVMLGGTFGPGTVVYALCIGPLVQPLLPLLDMRRTRPASAPGDAAELVPQEAECTA